MTGRREVSRLIRGNVVRGTKMTRIDMVFDWKAHKYARRQPGEHVNLRKSQKRTVAQIMRVMKDRRLRAGPAAVYQFRHKNRSLIFAGPRL